MKLRIANFFKNLRSRKDSAHEITKQVYPPKEEETRDTTNFSFERKSATHTPRYRGNSTKDGVLTNLKRKTKRRRANRLARRQRVYNANRNRRAV